jgi:hypothetical protein
MKIQKRVAAMEKAGDHQSHPDDLRGISKRRLRCKFKK